MGEHSQQDAAREWRAAVDRVCELVEDVGPQRMEAIVPACPEWTARELLAHMVGLAVSVLAGDDPAGHHAAWTRAHVDARRDRDTTALCAEWVALADDVAEHVSMHGPRPLADVVVHEHDLRGALDVPGARDSAGLVIVSSMMFEQFDQRVRAARLPMIALDAGLHRWDTRRDDADGDTVVELHADVFELSRALVSRRSADELRSWVRRGDVGEHLACFELLGPLPTGRLRGG